MAELVKQFSIAYITLDRSIPLKFHVVMEHLIPSLANHGGKGFGFGIEQIGESVHQHFQTKFWDRLVLLQTWIFALSNCNCTFPYLIQLG